MKLLAKFNKANIIATVFILFVGAICFYFILHYVLLSQLDKELYLEEEEIADYVKRTKVLPNPANYKNLQIVFAETDSTTERILKSVSVFDAGEEEFIVQRKLNFPLNNSGKNYNVSVSKSQQETEDLLQLIGALTFGLIALLFLGLFIINRFVFNKLWHPFYNTLNELKKFDLNDNSDFHLDYNNIIEFEELNNAVIKMRTRVLHNYNALKGFTENSSHEIQSPLAIMKANVEMLVQAENLSETQMDIIQTLNDQVSHLAKLNQSLLLLTKIENRQFHETQQIFFANIIIRQLNNFEELFLAKHISVTTNLDTAVMLHINENMAEVLISNLITNTIKHNVESGSVDIKLTPTELKFSNTGSMLHSEPMELFERFKKDNIHSESLGLGLSIVKMICDRYNYEVNYQHAKGVHTVTILFQGG